MVSSPAIRPSSTLLLVTALLSLAHLAASAPAAPAPGTSISYVAAVAQHPTGQRQYTPFFTKVTNLHVYEADAAAAKEAGAQVIVFPEFGLLALEDIAQRETTVNYAEAMPEAGKGLVPCDQPDTYSNSPAVYYGSCMARNNSIVVLINGFEVVKCTPSPLPSPDPYGPPACPSDGMYIYNTDLLFDEQGVLVAKYRKSHPFYIFSVNAPPVVANVTYTSNFGVTFGLFICFDIAFSHPALDLVHAGVHDFLYAAAIGEIGAATVAKLWSWTNHANLLLANQGASDSAIYSQGDSIATKTIAVPNTPDSILVATINTTAFAGQDAEPRVSEE